MAELTQHLDVIDENLAARPAENVFDLFDCHSSEDGGFVLQRRQEVQERFEPIVLLQVQPCQPGDIF